MNRQTALRFFAIFSCFYVVAGFAEDSVTPPTPIQINKNLVGLPAIFHEQYEQLNRKNKTAFEAPDLEKRARRAFEAKKCSLTDKVISALLANEKGFIANEYLDFFASDFRTALIQINDKARVERALPLVLEAKYFGSTPDTEFVRDYYKNKYGSDATKVLLVTFEELDGKVAAFVPPATREALSWPVRLEKLECSNGKKVDFEFDVPVTLRGSKLLSLAVTEKVFGSPYVITTSKLLTSKIKNKGLFDSVLVHELKHYFDYEKDSSLFEITEESERELIRKTDPIIQRALHEEFPKYQASAAFQTWLQNGAQAMHDRNPTYALEDLAKLIEKRIVAGYRDEATRIIRYLHREVEVSAHTEQVAFLKAAHDYNLDQVMAMLSNDGLIPHTVTLKSGKTVSLTIPPYPFQVRYFTELYEKAK